jgi:hypothetical protein
MSRPTTRRRSRRATRAALVIDTLAVVVSACRPALPAGKPAPIPPMPGVMGFFDACTAPSLGAMDTWWQASPYEAVGIYIGGNSRACAQPNLSATWVSTVVTQGWNLVPIWVGPQAPCTNFSRRIDADPALTYTQGMSEAQSAAAAAQALGITYGPIYYDMEGYTRGGTCSAAVQNFMTGWADGLRASGQRSGMYSSLCSGILDAAAAPGSRALDYVWIAAWPYDANDPRYATFVPNLTGFTGCGAELSDTLWASHQRLRQYRGGHNEGWGGAVMNVDSNVSDGGTFPIGIRLPT